MPVCDGSTTYANKSVPMGRVLFEIGGHVEVRQEVAKEGKLSFLKIHSALRLAAAKLPIRTEFITTATPPRLGREVGPELAKNKTPTVSSS